MATLNADNSETNICFTINNVSQLTTLHSSSITLQDLSWKIMIFKSQKENALGIRLTCLGPTKSNRDWSCAATASMELRSFNPNQGPKKETILPYVFCASANHTGRMLINWPELINPASGYVQDDKIKLEVRITARDLINNNKTNIQVVNRVHNPNSHLLKMRLTVHDASSLVAASSAPFDFSGLSWKIVVAGPGYRPIEKTKFSCMLWCISDNAPSNWNRDILGSISFLGREITLSKGPEKIMNFNEKCVKRFFTDSIFWNVLINTHKGYIRNDYIVLEIELKSQRAVDIASTSQIAPRTELPCTICFESMIGREVVRTDCEHVYCKTCISAWIRERPNCPVCDKVVTLERLHRLYLP